MRLLYLLLITPTLGHIQMIKPIPRGSPRGPWPESEKDYNIMAPLNGVDKTYPCQGKPKGQVMESWQAGTSIKVNFDPKTMHNGGHCQWSISYDDEKTFITIETMIETCLQPSNLPEYTIKLPASLPSCLSCVFQWTWFNAIGNREMYSNCADVSIMNTLPQASQGFTGRKPLVLHVPNGIGKTIPEFTAGYDGRELFEQQPYLTIGANNAGVKSPLQIERPANTSSVKQTTPNNYGIKQTTPMLQMQKPVIASEGTSVPLPTETPSPTNSVVVYIFAALCSIIVVSSIVTLFLLRKE
jgi:hypothetical protein